MIWQRLMILWALCLTLGLALGVTQAAQAQAYAPAPAPAAALEQPQVSIEALTALPPDAALRAVAQLPDAETRLLLLEELDRRRDASAGPPPAGGLAVVMVRLRNSLATQASMFGERLALVGGGIALVPSEVRRILGDLAPEGSTGMALLVLVSLIASLAGAIAARGFVRQRSRAFRQQLEAMGGGLAERVGRTTLRLLLEIAGWLAFAAVGFGLNAVLLAEHPAGSAFVSGYVTAGFLILAVAGLSRLVLSPGKPELCPFGISDELALFLDRWIVRLAAVGSIVWLTTAFILLQGKPPLGVKLTLLLLSGLVVMATVIAAILAARRSFPPAPATSRPLTLPDLLRTQWHRFAIAYVLVVGLFWAGGMLTTGQTVLWPAIASLLIVALLPLADNMARRAVHAVVDGLLVDRYTTAPRIGDSEESEGPETAEAEPAAAETAERSVAVIQRVMRIVLGSLAALALLQLWGLDPLARVGTPGADHVWAAVFNIAVTIALAYVVWQLVEAALTRQTKRMISTSAAQWDSGDLAVDMAGDAGEPSPTMAMTSIEGGAADARARTLLPLIRKFILAVLAVMVTMIILSSIGVDIGPLLAGAGVVGLAIGFGAQSLVRDVVSGVFFLIDDAFRIGEYIEMDQIRGEVEAITPRSLRLRHHRGAVHTIPFGELRYITNYNRDWTIYKMKMRVAGDTDPQLVKRIIKTIGKEMLADPELGGKFLEPLKSQGIFEIDDDGALVIRVKFMSKPREQFVLRREALHRIQKAFAEQGIAFAKRNVEVNVLSGQQLDPVTREAVSAGAATTLEERAQAG